MRTSYLFTRPSFRRGVGRLMDLGGAMNDAAYRFSRTPRASDVRAMHADWLAVGDDLTRAMSEAEGLIDPVRADDEVG